MFDSKGFVHFCSRVRVQFWGSHDRFRTMGVHQCVCVCEFIKSV